MDPLAASLAVLSAMITPAVLISACASLILTTSQRLNRVIDRTRKLADQLKQLAPTPPETTLSDEERTFLFEQLSQIARRARMLQRTLASLYLALAGFVATSVAIGIVALSGQRYAWLPVVFGLTGAALLLYASILLILESRMALATVNAEMNWVIASR